MIDFRTGPLALAALAVCLGLSKCQQDLPASNGIAMPVPGDPLYYLNADAGLSVAPTVSLKRTNRSLLKWWDDLFLRNNCCNNNNNVVYPPAPVVPPLVNNNCNGGLQLQDLDPFKQIKLFKKLPDLFTPPSPCGQTCGGCGQLPQPQPNYVAPLAPAYGGEGYAPVPEEEYVKPSPNYDGPGDGNAGYVSPPATDTYVAPVAPAPAAVTYEAPAPAYEAPAPAPAYEAPAPAYEAPVAPPAAYAAPAPPAAEYVAPPPPAPAPAADVYAQPAPAAAPQLPPIVYQPIIYVSSPLVSKSQVQADENPAYGAQPAPPAPVYEAPAPVNYPPPPSPCGGYPSYAPSTPNYATPSCQAPIRLSLIDQPYRVAPELFEEYNYRLDLAAQNLI
ncbi:skin secretory protein xP2 [Drosophila bipectinata]|uniref:skin secretory protein xP2 n=1 Tax=Drosophila bipectinata TaxID=42026 RepID=UPI001C8903A2|nr:skin secretory protein xP2 [Drosophila bipectinata]